MINMTLHGLRTITLHGADPASVLSCEKDHAIKALCDDAVFEPASTSTTGPYDLKLSIHDGRLVIDLTDADGTPLPTLILSMTPYRRLIRDYFMMIESYETTRQTGDLVRLEAIDMGRRGLHDEGATLLIDRLQGKITLDHATARRVFTLLCALHGNGFLLL